MKPKYINKKGYFRINDLFIETCNGDAIMNKTSGRNRHVFTLKPEDYTDLYGETYPSFQKMFIDCNDPTGYEFAMKHLGSYEHFVQLQDNVQISAVISHCKEVVKSKLDSDSIKEIKRIATSGGSQVELSAAKYLANREYEEKGSVGRAQRKATGTKAASEARKTSLDTKRELERLGLH